MVYNRPSSEDSSNEYAGFLMALGLQGHLSGVPDYDLYNLLKEKHELTAIGLLLGVTSARCVQSVLFKYVMYYMHAHKAYSGASESKKIVTLEIK